ncbi:MAG: hypothetical protein KF841_15970 [Phycisphaerae bacterium]|nr:hypothetical protein [Phycisphaerae bacterium]
MMMRIFESKAQATFVGAAMIALAAAARPIHAHPGAHHDIERVTKLLEAQPDDVERLIERAHFYRLDYQPQAALADLAHARKLAPDRPDIPFHVGMVYLDLARHADADAEFSIAIKSGLTTSRAHAARARARTAMKDFELALADYARAIEIEPSLELYAERGALHVQLNRLDDAAAGYQEAIKRLGNAPILSQTLIDVEIRRGRYDAALTLIDEECNRAALKADWLLLRADVLDRVGRIKEAADARATALAEVNRVLARRQIGVHLVTRGRILLAMGRLAEARCDVELALKKSPNYSAAQILLDKLVQTEKARSSSPAKSVDGPAKHGKEDENANR